jgi:thymidylate synthase
MLIIKDSLDDILNEVFQRLHSSGKATKASRGNFVELTGVLIKLGNPRSRLSRSETKGRPFSCIGELFWYLSGRNDLSFIEYFIPRYAADAEADGTLRGAYGPRLFPNGQPNQFEQVLNLLKHKPTTRRAVIQLFSSEDISIGTEYKEIPCTTTIQFMIRDNLLECFTTMRSNDAFKGLPHDIFCFTMIQEMIARCLNLEIGTYHHFVSSLHIYEVDVNKAEQYLAEGFHENAPMPEMSNGNPFPIIPIFLEKMDRIRQGEGVSIVDSSLPDYWNDLLRLMIAYHHSQDQEVLDIIHNSLSDTYYFPFVERRKAVSRPKVD